jgi:drug/metabolite transporter (DMT)-like permease
MAFLASVFFAIANYITSDLALLHGIGWMFPSFISSSIIWVIFHIWNHREKNKDEKSP